MCPSNRLDEAFSLSPDFLSKMQRDFGEASSEKAGRSNRWQRNEGEKSYVPCLRSKTWGNRAEIESYFWLAM